MSKHESLIRLRELVGDLFDARHRGVEGPQLARIQGLADGYMRALSDLGLAENKELLTLISNERGRAADRADLGFSLLLTQPAAGPI